MHVHSLSCRSLYIQMWDAACMYNVCSLTALYHSLQILRGKHAALYCVTCYLTSIAMTRKTMPVYAIMSSCQYGFVCMTVHIIPLVQVINNCGKNYCLDTWGQYHHAILPIWFCFRDDSTYTISIGD